MLVFFRLYDVMEELSGLFGGRKIDLLTPGGILRDIRLKVFEEAEVQFER